MAEIKKHDDLKVAVVIDGSTYLTQEEGEVWEAIDKEMLLYLKSKDGTKEIKIRIFK